MFCKLQLERNELRKAQSSKYNAKEFPLGNRSMFGLFCMRINNLPTSRQHCVLLKHYSSGFITASHAHKQHRAAGLKSVRHLPFPSHLAHLWIGTAPQLRFRAYGSSCLIMQASVTLAYPGWRKERREGSFWCLSWQMGLKLRWVWRIKAATTC